MKKLAVVIVLIFSLIQIKAQNYIQVVKVGSINSNFDFTTEWQYVTSDLYMFNADKFADILNQVITGKKRKLFRKKGYDIKNILVTLNLKGLGQYDKITYPLYNFIVELDEEGNYKVSTESAEVFRIVDNYPTPNLTDFIEAKVDVKVITKDKQVQVYKFAASQLETIAAIATNPTTAVMQLVGEFGKMIEAVADGKEYHFTSTIRIFENENFNKKLHSIVVFVFVPSQVNEFKIDVDLDQLQKIIQQNPDTAIDRKFLYQFIKIKKYPYVVIVNYKSKYIPDVPEEIDFDILKMREARLQTDLNKGVISKEIYALEKELIQYLKIYAQLQLDLNNYFLNLENRTTEDFSKFYYFILRDYWNMLNTYKTTLIARQNDRIFNEEFKPIYEKFLQKAELELDKNPNLQNIKTLVKTIFELENNKISNLDSAKIENILAKINAVPLPESEKNSPEIQLINKWKQKLENQIYEQIFRKQLELFASMPVNDQTYNLIINFQRTHSETNCSICRQKMQQTVDQFLKKYTEYKLQLAKNNFENLRNKTKLQLIAYTKKISCIKQNLENYPTPKPEYIQLIEQDIVNIDQQRQTLIALLNKNYIFTKISEIEELTKEIQTISKRIAEALDNLCKQEPKICDCTPKPPKQKTDTLTIIKTKLDTIPKSDTTSIQLKQPEQPTEAPDTLKK